jgi:C1q domain
MALTHALSINNYGVAHLIVATSAANGSHTTLASAMADAVSGDTIFLRDSVTENVTITPGVNITCWSGSALNVPSITGTLTMTGAGTSTISGLRLVTNSAALIAITGSAASILNVNRCYLNCSNNTGITFSTSDSGGTLNINDCSGDLGTTGIGLFTHTSAGTIAFKNSFFSNSGGSSTASSISSGVLNINQSQFFNPITMTSTSAGTWTNTNIGTATQNVTAANLNGGSIALKWCELSSGSASAASIASSAATMQYCLIKSSNTNSLTGAGTLSYSGLSFGSTSNIINVTTQTALIDRIGTTRSTLQPAFLATASLQSDVTGDNTAYTILYANEIFDQNGDYNPATGIFTAPVTGRYQINVTTALSGLGVANTTGTVSIVATSRTIAVNAYNWGVTMTAGTVVRACGSVLLDMTATDTCKVVATITGGTKVVDVLANDSTFSGFLVC